MSISSPIQGDPVQSGPVQGEKSSSTPALPTWNLKDLYASVDDPKIAQDLKILKQKIEKFCETYQGKIKALTPIKVVRAIEDYEEIIEILGKIGGYSYLSYATDKLDPKVAAFFQSMSEKTNDLTSKIVFFTLDLNKRDDLDKDPAFKKYASWLRDIILHKPHDLAENIESLLHEKSITGREAWVRLFDETLERIEFRLEGNVTMLSTVLTQTQDSDAQKRREAYRSLGTGLKENIHLFTFITNTLAKDKDIEDQWRHFTHPVASRNLQNSIEDAVVDALIKAVKESYPQLSHRYYRLKAQIFGKTHLNYWDRNAPLPEVIEVPLSWEEAKEKVLKAYRGFSPEMADLAQNFFDKKWIDAAPRKGKNSGAFSHPMVPSVHPYVLVNYHGKAYDVMVLAHELGHGVHQMLAAPQGCLMADTPLTIAETASVFGEMLTFQNLMKETMDLKKRRYLLASKIEDMLNTVIRQVAFFDFERRVHIARQKGELSSEDLGKIWMETQRESLGDAILLDEEYQNFWAYIPHFIHSPFYVYSYAFGACLVNSLYAVYQQKPEGFEKRYLDLLRAGGTVRYDELLLPFGLDAKDPNFWRQGLAMIGHLIDDLETLNAQIKG